jgi:hypothetical protein
MKWVDTIKWYIIELHTNSDGITEMDFEVNVSNAFYYFCLPEVWRNCFIGHNTKVWSKKLRNLFINNTRGKILNIMHDI